MFFYSEPIQENIIPEPTNPGAVYIYLNNDSEPLLLYTEDGQLLEFYV